MRSCPPSGRSFRQRAPDRREDIMVITEVRVKLVNRPNDKLRAFCSITLDNALVVRDLKIIEGAKGPFVAMPSRKLTDRCPKCGGENHIMAKYCNDCGCKLEE